MTIQDRKASRTAIRASALLTALLLGATACDDSPTRDEQPDPTAPVTNPVLLDVNGSLEATEIALDTYRVAIPENHVLGVIFESDAPIAAQWGARSWREVMIMPAGKSAAVITDISGGEAYLRVRQGEWGDMTQNDYRIRVVGIPMSPEHGDAEIRVGNGLHDEWIDLPLDVDVFAVDLEEGERFRVESDSELGESVTVRVQTPGGARYIAFVATGAELEPSPLFLADESGTYLISVTTAGLVPDVATSYRLRVVGADEE